MLGYKENYFMALFKKKKKRVKQRPEDGSWALGHSTLGVPELGGVRIPGWLRREKSGPAREGGGIWPKRRATPSDFNDKRISRGKAAAWEGFGGVTIIF